ncbi:hypothetical protein B0H13DRAFT_938644 [Mycena leptocephala]|nr:hypothetical protein B0H13DRAFT_938644 [Mycena leptocephala]
MDQPPERHDAYEDIFGRHPRPTQQPQYPQYAAFQYLQYPQYHSSNLNPAPNGYQYPAMAPTYQHIPQHLLHLNTPALAPPPLGPPPNVHPPPNTQGLTPAQAYQAQVAQDGAGRLGTSFKQAGAEPGSPTTTTQYLGVDARAAFDARSLIGGGEPRRLGVGLGPSVGGDSDSPGGFDPYGGLVEDEESELPWARRVSFFLASSFVFRFRPCFCCRARPRICIIISLSVCVGVPRYRLPARPSCAGWGWGWGCSQCGAGVGWLPGGALLASYFWL